MLEGRGIPAVVLGTDAFVSLARAAATTHGVAHLPVVTVPHPIGGVAPATVSAKAEAIVDEVLAALTTDPAPAAAAAPQQVTVVQAPDDLDAFQDWAVAGGWSDGLPVLPPTRARVARILAGGAGDARSVIATLAPLSGVATPEAIAINAALAGAAPEHSAIVPTFGSTRSVTIRIEE